MKTLRDKELLLQTIDNTLQVVNKQRETVLLDIVLTYIWKVLPENEHVYFDELFNNKMYNHAKRLLQEYNPDLTIQEMIIIFRAYKELQKLY